MCASHQQGSPTWTQFASLLSKPKNEGITTAVLKHEACDDTNSATQAHQALGWFSGFKAAFVCHCISFFPKQQDPRTVQSSNTLSLIIISLFCYSDFISRSSTGLRPSRCLRPVSITSLWKKKKLKIKMVVSYTGMILLWSCRVPLCVAIETKTSTWQWLPQTQLYRERCYAYSCLANHQGQIKMQC